MFSNSTEGEMFTAAWCTQCVHAYEGDQICEAAEAILFGDPPPSFLRRVEMTPANPVGVECDRFERKP